MMEKELIAFEDVRQLAQKMHNAGLRELEWRGADWSVRLRYPGGKTMAEPPPLSPPPAEPRLLPVCSPMPGRLLLSHPSHGEAFVSEGQRVEPDDILALVQVGALYLPVRSPVAGTLKSLVATSGNRLEYGSEIALLLPADAASAKL
ncbi:MULTISPECIES: acetyl-CoA carboxylase biotin carboxyl carrier protein [Raoultella]|uniref:acetyl-CoA carboxylase biotin carboxyl carrier protein n=1 Tax=Raoultella TaxID=160674 RepID=UPI001D0D7210|nr:acetyl-CoA carboxylase biotin carboxyl carrier protein subunit [Raoultella ornithinolytica]